jgi:carboxymethylenebutenolidase
MDPRIINLYDEYTHRPLSREVFIRRLMQLTGGITAAMTILPMLEGNYAAAQTTQSNNLFTERVNYPAAGTMMKAYVARPLAMQKYPAVIVIHENRGLNPHIEDVTRRAALAGFLAIAPDGLSPVGGTPSDEDAARDLFSKLIPEENTARFAAALPYLKKRSDANGAIGCVGFCWGGAMANSLAVSTPELKAAVAFYGRQPEIEKVAGIKAAVQLHYAGLDERVNAGLKAYEEALKANGIRYEQYIYEGVNHAFHNDSSAARYNKDAATLAWARTIAFLTRYLV